MRFPTPSAASTRRMPWMHMPHGAMWRCLRGTEALPFWLALLGVGLVKSGLIESIPW